MAVRPFIFTRIWLRNFHQIVAAFRMRLVTAAKASSHAIFYRLNAECIACFCFSESQSSSHVLREMFRSSLLFRCSFVGSDADLDGRDCDGSRRLPGVHENLRVKGMRSTSLIISNMRMFYARKVGEKDLITKVEN